MKKLNLKHMPSSKNQKGSVLIQFALLAGVLITILGTVQIGYMYYAKRDLQRIADVSAIEAVNSLSYAIPDSCPAATASGLKSIDDQLRLALDTSEEPEVTCGHWNENLEDNARFSSTYGARGNNPLNAVKVKLEGETLRLLPFIGNRTVSAESIAAKKSEPVAAFSVGPQLLRFDETSPLGGLLGAVGLHVDDLRLLDSDGLASAKITPSGLLDLLGVDLGIQDVGLLTPNGVADIKNVTLLNLIDASVNAVTDNTLGVQLNALRARLVNLGLGNIEIPLGNRENGDGGLFAFVGIGRDQPLDNALDVEIGLSDILKTAIAIGNGENALDIPQLNVAGLVQAKVSIVEPPTIAIGPVGTQGYSAQIRINLDLDTSKLLGGLGKFLLEDILGTRVHLPIAIDVVSATGTLEAIQCQRTPPTIDLSIDSRILNACVGNIPASNISSTRNGCEVGLDEEELIRLLHMPILSGKLHIPALRYEDFDSGLNMKIGDIRSSKPNQLQLGDTVDDLVTGLLNLLSGLFRNPTSSGSMIGDWDGDYTKIDITEKLVESYLGKSAENNNGFYNVENITKLILQGEGNPTDEDYLPPLLKSDFTFNNAIPKTCLLITCPSSTWNSGTFSEAFHSYTSVPFDILGIVGIPTFDNGYQSCAGLLSSLLNWNGCVKHNLIKLLKDHSTHVTSIDPNSQEIQSILNKNSDEVQCNGALCTLLKPILQILKPILNGIGSLVTNLLDDVLGLELGRTDVEAIDIQCDAAQIVQ